MKEHNISEFLDDEDDINKKRLVQAGVIREIAKCGKEMSSDLNRLLAVLIPTAIFVIVLYIFVMVYFFMM